jgi:hypothetical protein
MHPLSDKDLDRLSREAAEQYDVEQNTSGWDKLEQKLNKHLPEKGRKERRRFLFLIWLCALLSGGGLLWMLTGNPSPQMTTLKEGSSKIILPPTDNKAPDQLSEKDITKSDNTDRSDIKADDRLSSVQDREEILNGTRSTTVPENKGQNKSTSRIQKSGWNKRNSAGIDNDLDETKARVANEQKITRTKPGRVEPSVRSVTEQSDQKDNKIATVPDNSKPRRDISSPTQNQPEPDKIQSVTDSSKKLLVGETKKNADSNNHIKKTAVPKNKSGFKKGLEIGLVAAPDMSNVKFTHSDKIGFNVGIQLAYRISQRWSANTGVIYTQKNYASLGKDFNPPKGSWLDNVKLDMVEGSCFMFDIPVNVRYDLNTSDDHRLFLSTGLSTYLMKKEDYHYHYQYTNGSQGYRYRSYPSGERYWLSILNISAGFEKKLNKRLSFQAEPYLKIPLTGVGYGNLKLNSYGVYFSLKYNTGLLSGKK